MGCLVSENEYYSGKEEIPRFSLSGRHQRFLEDINSSHYPSSTQYGQQLEEKMSEYLMRQSERLKQLECQNQDNSGPRKVLSK